MQLQNGQFLLSNGVNPLEIVEQHGCPLYVYDAAIIEHQYKRFTKSFHVKSLKVNYACKALTNINVLKLMKQMGAGLDTVSIQEVQLGIKAGFKPEEIIFTPNCVSLEEIEMAMKVGVKINIDNISILEQFGHLYSNHPVCIRINPHIMAGGNSKISVGHIDSKFGISFHQIHHIKKIVETLDMTIEGIHMHTGSDILDVGAFLRGAEVLLNVARDFPDLNYVDFGSGFKVSYYEGGASTNIEELGQQLSDRFNEFCEEYGRDLTLMFEPGKFMVSEAGYFFVKVNVIKQTISTMFAGVDSGLNHLIRPMFYDAHHDIVNVSSPMKKPRIYNVVGYICETDTFGVNRKISEIQEGDILAFRNAGAYCFTMASNYNSRFRPAEVMVHNGKAHLIRKRETMEDIMRNQVEPAIFDVPIVEKTS